MKKLHLLLTLLILALTLPILAETIAQQSFESSTDDTWTYTANPTPDSKRIWWGPTSESMGGANAYHENLYWAGWEKPSASYPCLDRLPWRSVIRWS